MRQTAANERQDHPCQVSPAHHGKLCEVSAYEDATEGFMAQDADRRLAMTHGRTASAGDSWRC